MVLPCAPNAKVVRFMSIMVDMFHHLRSLAVEALTVPHYMISFFREPTDHEQEQPEPSHNILVMDGLSPSLVTVPTHVLTTLIKNRSPVVQYGAYLDQNREGTVRSGEGKSSTECPVCLGRIFQVDEIRELCNCCHVFHRECLDRWVDEKKVTCPLCRAALFPTDWDWRRCSEDPWKTERDGYFSGEEDDEQGSSVLFGAT